jgi:16S rRNA (adenine1518-N6/adenine1519-N6)-dimethyltransferase
MELPPINVPALLRQFELRPDKRLGQNFLTDMEALKQIIVAAQITDQDTVLEVGPGLGSLTRLLALQSHRVIAVELDDKLIPPLQQVLAPHPNVQIIQGDILALDLTHLIGETDYLVVANIPYYITSILIRHFLEANQPPRRLVLTVQGEVAERICALPGDLSLLALSVQVYGQPNIVARIPSESFYPPPQVDSAVVRVDRFAAPRIPPELLSTFFSLAKAGFSQKRKTLRNALAAGLHWAPSAAAELLLSAGIDPQRRAETVSLEEWGNLTRLTLLG